MSERARGDEELKIEVKRVFDSNFGVYGVRRVWWQFPREGFHVARCTVARLMTQMGLKGVIRGQSIRTTISNQAAACPLDHVKRQFHAPAPNRLWLSDFTYVATWTGFVYVAFVIDAYARTDLCGGRSAMAIPIAACIKYMERLAAAGIEPSVGSVGDSYDNAIAEIINGLYKTELIHPRGPWRSFETGEFATLEWVDWFNHRRLMGLIGNVSPAEAEQRYYAQLESPALAA